MTDDTKITGPADMWNLIAKTRGVPPGWRWFRLQVADVKAPRHQSASLVTGAVCTERFKSGPRKGELNWAKRDKSTERTLVIPFSEFDAFEAKWESDNDACSNCGGSGKWSSGGTCSSCKGSGKPRARPPAGSPSTSNHSESSAPGGTPSEPSTSASSSSRPRQR